MSSTTVASGLSSLGFASSQPGSISYSSGGGGAVIFSLGGALGGGHPKVT